MLSFASPALADQALVISSQVDGASTHLFAENTNTLVPYHAQLSFDVLKNLACPQPQPLRFVVAPGKRIEICALTKVAGSLPTRYHCNFNFGFGDPKAVPDPAAVYLLPYQPGTREEITQGYFGQITHQNCRCLDFDFAEGTPIYAARAGLVITVKQDFTQGGVDKRFNPYANAVEILHSDGTWASYAHLRPHGAAVRLGQHVEAGQLIGYSGHTGQASGPHLHFAVNKAGWDGVETVATPFLMADGHTSILEEGQVYEAFHPAAEAFRMALPASSGKNPPVSLEKAVGKS